MTLLDTINHAGRRIFFHFHDDFKEEEHPRATTGKHPGQFVKKGTGGGGPVAGPSSEKPTAAKGAVVVDPVAKVLKSHGYVKQKGSNVFTHPTGHEVEVHAASEGQKWLTGWTHGTTGNTGSGAGKLDKHLQSLPHGLVSQMPPPVSQPDPFEKKMQELSTYKPKPPPKTLADYPPMTFTPKPPTTIQAKSGVQHPLPKVHAGLSTMGFVPTSQNVTTTTYEHPDKGKVVVRNQTYKSGYNKGKAYWEYYANSNDTKPSKIGYGVNNGQLQQSVQAHSVTPPSLPPATPSTSPSDVVKPSWSNHNYHEETQLVGEPADRYSGDPDYPEESIIIGKGENNKGYWQIWNGVGNLAASGKGQKTLNEEFEKLHPRGEGGKFIAKPGGVDQADHEKLLAAGYKPLGTAPWGSGVEVYAKEDGSIVLTKSLPNEMKKSIFPLSPTVLETQPKTLEALTSMLGGKTPKVGEVPGETVAPSGTGTAPVPVGAPKNAFAYVFPHKEGGIFVTEDATIQELNNGMKVINSNETGKWEITDQTGATLEFGAGKLELDAALKKLSGGSTEQNTPSDILSSAVSIFKPLQANGFDINTSAGGFLGVLNNDPDKLKMVFNYNVAKQDGVVSWQVAGDPAGAQTVTFKGPAGVFYAQVKGKYDEAKAASVPVISVQHFTLNGDVPAELNGVAFSPYTPPTDWTSVEGTNEHLQEPPLSPPPGKKVSCGVLIEEPDGRVWLVKPTNEFGGYKYTFPKGGQELGLSMQQTAIKEAWEESGLKAEITGYAGDYLGDTSITRYYYAKRTGGTPTGFQPNETEQVSLIPKEELHKYLNKARDLQIAKDHFTPKAIGRSIHFNSMTKIGEKKGSNPGGIYQSPSGKKYYIKMPKTNQHAANELLAAELMSKAGGGTLKYHQITADGGMNYVGTEWETLQKDNVNKLSLNERKMAQSDFAINAWLANWDAAGLGGDNTGVLNGKTVTLDVGGALLYRAQGTPKGDAFGNVPTEWQTLRDPAKNADAAKLYGDMTQQQLKESAEKLNQITNKDIQDAVHNHFDVQDIVGDDLIDKLIARRDKIIQYGAMIPAPAAQPTYTPSVQPTYTPSTPPAPTSYPKQHPDSKWSGNPEYHSLLKHSPTPTQKEGGAISKYSGGAYSDWNKALRNSIGTNDGGHPTRDLMSYLAKASFPEERIVKRRIDQNFADWLIGQAEDGVGEFTDHGFASTDHWSGKLTLRIRVPQGAQAAAIGNYSVHPGEDEILIQSGSHYKITKYDPKTATMDVDLVRSGMSQSYAKKLGRPAGVVHKKTISE